MLQVDANIGGRQDQKNNGLRTKTWAVGLLIVLGCFVVGYFGATTTTTTAYTRMSSPNGNSCHIYKKQIICRKILFNSVPTTSLSTNSCIFFSFKHNVSLAPVKSMTWSPIYNVIRTSLLQTKHRTRPLSSTWVMGNMPIFFVMTVQTMLIPDRHGRHRRELLVLCPEWMPPCSLPRRAQA